MSDPKKINWNSIFSFQYILSTVIGVSISVVALKGFMIPNNFVDGDVTAISILFKEIFQIHISYFLVILNLPFLYIGYRIISRTFALKSLIAIILLAVLMFVLEF